MVRRVHVHSLVEGDVELSPEQSHHVRDVLRLGPGDRVELFDDQARTAAGEIVQVRPGVVVRTAEVRVVEQGFTWTVCSAIPKGPRADWMIEKLAELGTARFIPLIAGRSVVVPGGEAKLARWQRIAAEAARQSRSPRVMAIEQPTELDCAIAQAQSAPGPQSPEALPASPCHTDPVAGPSPLPSPASGRGGHAGTRFRTAPNADGADSQTRQPTPDTRCWYLSTAPGAISIADGAARLTPGSSLALFVGPEGGWTDEELKLFDARGLTGISLGRTILRIETAAVAAAVIAAAVIPGLDREPIPAALHSADRL